MTVSTKTRKILWARSGNRCAICRCELVVEGTVNDPAAVVGDECHIVSKRPKGPRSHQETEVEIDLDSYDNLILLCKTHHKLVDDQMERFPAQRLRKIKAAHEHWVREALGGQGAKSQDGLNGPSFNGVTLMPRIKTGKELVSVIRGAHFFRFDNDEVESQEEMEIVSEFLQYLYDWGDILDQFGAGEIVRVGFQLNQELEELERNGFLVFGERRRKRMNCGGLVDTWQVATVLVLREGNPAILNLDK